MRAGSLTLAVIPFVAQADYDRLLALRFGAAAVRAIAEGAFGIMVGLKGPGLEQVPLEEVVGKSKNVPLDSDTIATARELGISLGD